MPIRAIVPFSLACAVGLLSTTVYAQSWQPPSRERTVSVEVGRRRRTRLRQSHDTRRPCFAPTRVIEPGRRRAWPRPLRHHAVLRHATVRAADQADVHEPAVEPARQQRGNRRRRARTGRHAVRRLRAPDDRRQRVQLLHRSRNVDSYRLHRSWASKRRHAHDERHADRCGRAQRRARCCRMPTRSRWRTCNRR